MNWNPSIRYREMRFRPGTLLSKKVDWREQWCIPLPLLRNGFKRSKTRGYRSFSPPCPVTLDLTSVAGDARPPSTLQSKVANLDFVLEVSI